MLLLVLRLARVVHYILDEGYDRAACSCFSFEHHQNERTSTFQLSLSSLGEREHQVGEAKLFSVVWEANENIHI